MSLEVHSMAFEVDRTRQPARIERARLVSEALAEGQHDPARTHSRLTHRFGAFLTRAGTRLQGLPSVPPVLAEGGAR